MIHCEKAKRSPLAVNWCATLYNCTTEQINEIVKGNVKKAVFQAEVCPTTGRKHIQGFFSFNRRMRFSQVKNLFKDYQPHIEICRNVPKSIEYCSKEETREGPTIRIAHAETRDNSIRELIEKGDMETIRQNHYGYFIRNRRALFEDMVSRYKPTGTDHTRGIWLCGKPGTGKTQFVSNLEQPYFKGTNKWWDGYIGERVVVMDDVDNNIWKWGIQYIKRWTDKYPLVGEIKGGHMNIKHEWFIITSNERLNDSIYGLDNNHVMALKRRLIEISTDEEGWEDKLTAILSK